MLTEVNCLLKKRLRRQGKGSNAKTKKSLHGRFWRGLLQTTIWKERKQRKERKRVKKGTEKRKGEDTI
jgi:hypothetical protein